jgi:hypothetical protein
MTDTPSSRNAMLSRVEDTEIIWTNLVAEVGEHFDTPGPMGEWSFKDLAHHLNGWRVRTVNRLEAVAANREPIASPWPAEYEALADEDAQVDAINQWFQDQGKERSYADVLAEANEQFARLRTAIEAIPEDDLADVNKFTWLNGSSPSDVLRGSWEHLTDEHLRGVRSWLLNRQYNLQ